jgi:hypothetical protein
VHSFSYSKAKAHFQRVFSNYSKRAVVIKEYYRQEAENTAIDPREEREERQGIPEEVLVLEGQEAWRINPFDGFDDFLADQAVPAALPSAIPIQLEIDRWFAELILSRESTSEQ